MTPIEQFEAILDRDETMKHVVERLTQDEYRKSLTEAVDKSLFGRAATRFNITALNTQDAWRWVQYHPESFEVGVVDWDWLASLPNDRAVALLHGWAYWTFHECFPIFAHDYEVSSISSHTANRWRAFCDRWAELTLQDRQAMWAEYRREAEDQPELDPEWLLTFATIEWPGAIAMPYVHAQATQAALDMAVPRDAKGKKMDM